MLACTPSVFQSRAMKYCSKSDRKEVAFTHASPRELRSQLPAKPRSHWTAILSSVVQKLSDLFLLSISLFTSSYLFTDGALPCYLWLPRPVFRAGWYVLHLCMQLAFFICPVWIMSYSSFLHPWAETPDSTQRGGIARDRRLPRMDGFPELLAWPFVEDECCGQPLCQNRLKTLCLLSLTE
ncbi:hypothetical protein BO71DRAFT_232256 [Aspergillus ellipticus CBS 707.79]|uniref:Uncharacterized protein n=1 Tax=Aspergillus ellipticus CBS 707.79 TaxID=1448320 RepID=A0A319DA29_9EURO|nr:hypothetical protein BO71DRAFT_232256 [Aspergillus ellipticus CBS 707.79]